MMNAAIYRDLKPENFLLESTAPECGLKGCDFGLSVFYRPGQIFHDIVGSAYYIAPEVRLEHLEPRNKRNLETQ